LANRRLNAIFLPADEEKCTVENPSYFQFLNCLLFLTVSFKLAEGMLMDLSISNNPEPTAVDKNVLIGISGRCYPENNPSLK